jgi:DNA-binding transcriptional regulator YiaG
MDPNKIRELRRRLDLTQTEFAIKLGVSISSVQVWEYGTHKPSRMADQRLRELQAEVESTDADLPRREGLTGRGAGG